ncbi:hypothetical protein B0H11DRAFT_1941979 [Mycena galericulata]|nr:hypothetical protein B0H11DRAFT_1941979 [Mycena galericulata]
MAPKKPRAPPAEPLMHGIYCHRYYEKNREEVNHKTRERMRRLRASDVTVPPEVLAARLEARRAAARRYRERHQHRLKMKAREARAEAAEERRRVKEKQEQRERREAARQRAADVFFLATSIYAHYSRQSLAFATDGEQTETCRLLELRAQMNEEELRQEEARRREDDWIYVFIGALQIVMAKEARAKSLR